MAQKSVYQRSFLKSESKSQQAAIEGKSDWQCISKIVFKI